MGSKLRPLGTKVVVKRLEANDTTKGGIVLPDSAQEKPREGIVIAVGRGKYEEEGALRKLELKVEDRVIFSGYAGTEVKVDGEELLILDEADVLSVVDG